MPPGGWDAYNRQQAWEAWNNRMFDVFLWPLVVHVVVAINLLLLAFWLRRRGTGWLPIMLSTSGIAMVSNYFGFYPGWFAMDQYPHQQYNIAIAYLTLLFSGLLGIALSRVKLQRNNP